MATVGGLSTSTSGSIRGYGGLASGLDRDTLIEGMTMGTTNKITQQQQKQQKLEWKQAAVQNITSKLLDFANKYTSSWSSSTNLFSSVFWGRNKITTSGVNSKFISVSGSGTSAQNVKIMGVKQLAQKATWSASKGVSDSTLKTGNINFENWQNLRNQDLVFEVDGKSYTVTLAEKKDADNAYDYSTAAGIKEAINEQLSKVKLIGDDGKETGETLAGRIKVEGDNTNNKITFSAVSATEEAGKVKLIGGDAVKVLGITDPTKKNGVWDLVEDKAEATLSPWESLVNKDLKFKVGDKEYTLTLAKEDASGNAYDYVTASGAQKAIDEQLAAIKLSDTETLKDKINIKIDSSNNKIKISTTETDPNKEVALTGGSAIGILGIDDSEKKDGKWNLVNSELEISAVKSNLMTKFNDRIAGQELRFSYNGSAVSVYMPSASDFVNEDGSEKTENAKLEIIQDSLQRQLDSAFGKNRIQVDVKDGGLEFKTIKPVKKGDGDVELGTDKDKAWDTSSTLSITGGYMDLVNNVLNTKVGESNRINLSANIMDAGFAGITDEMFTETEKVTYKDADGKEHTVDRQRATIDINGTKVAVYKDDTMNALMERINANTDVKVTYQAETDKFVFTSKEDGASGKIDIKGSFAKGDNITRDPSVGNTEADDAEVAKRANNLSNILFGQDRKKDANGEDMTDTDGNYIYEDRKPVYGQDAIIAVKYAGSDEVVEINRGTNSFTMDGLTVNVKGEFGYLKDDDGKVTGRDTTTEAIEIDAQVDSDSIVNAVKAMVEEYNSIIELVHKEVSTKPDRDYSPLTSEQKKELDEDEIKTWEEKAKEGILYADSDIRGLSSDLRFIIDGGIAQELSEMGLSTSSTYSDNGKLVFDETKFRAALAKDPERVQEIFANESVTNTNKNGTSTGIATRLKNVLDKYVNTTGSMDTKGILIRKAGHESSPMSVTENTMYKQLDSIKKKIAELQERLETERDRYIKQFTSLETLISQMNSQSSWLSQFGGY